MTRRQDDQSSELELAKSTRQAGWGSPISDSQREQLAKMINDCFQAGGPSDTPERAGLLVHRVFDSYETLTGGEAVGAFCNFNCGVNFGVDHISASLIWAQYGHSHPWGLDKVRT